MPQYNWNQADLDAVTTALLSMKGPPPTSALQDPVVSRKEVAFHPTGSFAEVYERYKCYTCHKFNGYGGDLAPDLSYQGTRAQKQLPVDLLEKPPTLPPAPPFPIPPLNITTHTPPTLPPA